MSQLINRHEAIQKLKDHWQIEKFVFQADFHVPKNITLREGSKPFGYFRNIRFNGEIIEYPLVSDEKRINIYYVLKAGLEDGKQYEVELDLAKDEYRNKNPYLMIVKRFKKLESRSAKSDRALEKTINEIFDENININSPFQVVNLANSVESLATDIYSEDKRFIYELIQNADDAALDEDTELSIDILDNYVVISHNGAPFSSRDIRGLCSIGLGTKTNDATKTGYKGIGFKSVFGQPEGVVYVKTENTLFRFDREYAKLKGWNTKWGGQRVWEEKNGVVFNCPWQMMPILSSSSDDRDADAILNEKRYSVKTAIKINDSEAVYKNISSFFADAKFLLFLRRINKVTLTFQLQKLELEKLRSTQIENMVTLQSNQQNISNWYVKNWVHNIPKDIQKELKSDSKTPKKIQDMEKTEISFAINVNESFNQIQLLEPGSSPLYSYLPTTVREYNIPFIVNCNFLLDASREKIHKNRKWNEWLFQVIGYKTVECVEELLVNSLFETSYMSIFRNGIVGETDILCKKLNEGLKIGIDKFAVIKNRTNDFCKLGEIALDPYFLHNVDAGFPSALTSFLAGKKDGFRVKASNLIDLSDDNVVLKKVNVQVLNELHLEEFLSSKKLSALITTDNNTSILNFFRPFESKDESGKWYTAVTNNKLIVNHNGELDYISRVCFPITVDTDYEFQNTLIHSDVYRSIESDEDLIDWLEKLGVTDPGSIAYLEKEIIGRIPNCIKNDNYLSITEFIFELHTQEKLEDKHYVNLQELPLKTNKGFKKANQTVFSLAYNPITDFTKVLTNEAYLSEDYLMLSNSEDCKSFFKRLNVIEDVKFIPYLKKMSSDLPKEYVNFSNVFAREGHSYPGLIGVFHPNSPSLEVSYFLQSFSFIEKTNKLDFAQLFWERIFNNYILSWNRSGSSLDRYCPEREFSKYNLGQGLTISTLDEMNWGRYEGNLTKIPGYVFWCFHNSCCIPTKTGMQLARDTYTNSEYVSDLAGEYLPVFNLKTTVPDAWGKLLNLKSKFTLNDLLFILEKVSLTLRSKGFLKPEDERRLGLVYNELLSKIAIDPEITEAAIRNWALKHKLVSNSKTVCSPEKLIHISIVGFENFANGIETILIPKNVDSKHSNFDKLLTSFKVKIIDSFSYQAENQEVFYDLQIKLLRLIVPITLMLKNNMVINDLDKALHNRFIKISNINFIKCNNIRTVFEHDSELFEGDTVIYHFNQNENIFLISESWKTPSVILNISDLLSKLLSAVRLEKEIMMMLNMSDRQIDDYLMSLGVDIEECNKSEVFESITVLIQELENKSKPPASSINISSSSNLSSKLDAENVQGEIEGIDVKTNEKNDDNKENSFIKEVEDFISSELEGTEWSQHIVELKVLLQLDTAPGEQKKKVYNLLAKLKLAKIRNIQFEQVDESDRQYNYLEGNGEKYIVHSARGSFAYIAPIELLKMRDEGYMMALDFGNKTPVKIYKQADEILNLNTNHLLLYQNEKTIEELFAFCESNQSANKRLLIIDKDHASNKSKELLKLMIPDEDI